MAPDWLTETIDADAPCGPDLEHIGDEAFIDYYYDAEGRLPERYVTTGQQLGADGRPRDRLYDARSVDLPAERREVEALLRRSRDLRLLSLMARWEALAWEPVALSQTIEAMATLVAAQGDAVHPALPGRARDRRAALEALTMQAHLIQPLHHMPLAGAQGVTWRRWLLTQGQVEARPDEEAGTADAILSALSERGRAAEVDALHGAFSRMLVAARTLNPTLLAPLTDLLEGLLDLLSRARPDLTTPAAAAEAAPLAGAPETPGAQPETSAPLPLAGEPPTRGDARAALAAVRAHLMRAEPSSAALLLVIQAEQLIGKPLIVALETLLPKDAPRTTVDFGPAQGFVLAMDRLRALSAEIQPPEDAPATGPVPAVADRQAAASQLVAIAGFFRRTEPASPIPVLLDRARSWLGRDFEGLLAEILPSSTST